MQMRTAIARDGLLRNHDPWLDVGVAMIRIERNKTVIWIAIGLLITSLTLFTWSVYELIRSGITAFGIIFLILSIFLVIFSSNIVLFSCMELELTESGITKYYPFQITRRYEWRDFPYCYVVWYFNRKSGSSYSRIMFSKTVIDHERARKIRYDDSLNRFTPKPGSEFSISHTQQNLDKIRAMRPELQIEYRNTNLAKGQYKRQ